MQSLRYCGKPREIVVGSIPDGNLLGDGSGQPVFEGFSDSQADRNRPRVNHRISVLQTAKCGLLTHSLGSPDVVVPFSSGGLTSSSLSPTSPSGSLGFCRRVVLSVVDRQHSFRPSVVVGHTQHPCRGVARFSSYGPSLLVRRIRSRLGRSYRRPVCLRLVVAGRDWPIDQSPGVEGHSPRSSTLSVSARGVVSWGVCRQHHSSGLYSQAGGGTHSRLLNEEARLLLRWAESQQILLLPQFVMGTHNVVADSLSRPEVIGSEWTLAQDVVDQLVHRWPATIDLFAMSLQGRNWFQKVGGDNGVGSEQSEPVQLGGGGDCECPPPPPENF